MAAIRITTFAGAVPVADIRLLPDRNGAYVINARPGIGALEPVYRSDRIIQSTGLVQLDAFDEGAFQTDNTPANDLLATTRKIFRIPTSSDVRDIGDSAFLEFDDPDTDILRTPVVNDSYERYYWASPSHVLKFNTRQRITSGLPPYDVGVQEPATAPTLGVTGGTSGINTTRSYVTTFVSEYGEEGPPSPPAEIVGQTDSVFNITAIAQPVTNTQATITKIRIYRTITAASGATTFFRAGEILTGVTAFDDNQTDSVISGNPQIESISWQAPQDMDGLAGMPNGIFVGFKGQNLYFSEPFRPHAWPPEYRLSVQYPIVGLGVFGNTCVICTQGFPAAVTGSRPENMNLITNTSPAACVSRGSIVSTFTGVVYATENGLVLFGPGGLQEISAPLFDRYAWREEYNPTTIRAVQVDGRYFAVREDGDRATAFTFDPMRAEEGVFEMGDDAYGINVVPFIDIWTGRPLAVQERAIWHLMPTIGAAPATMRWRSKEFELERPLNMGVAQISFDTRADARVTLRVWADRVLAFDQVVTDRRPHIRLASGFKAKVWQFELEANTKIHALFVATSAKELRRV